MDLSVLYLPGLVVLGWLAGYLINYLADVLPYTRQLSRPVCLECGVEIPPRRYLLLQPCSQCGKRRSWRTWIVQVAAVAVVFALWFYPSTRLTYWPGLLLLIYFGLVAVIDIEHRLILHPVSIFGAVLGVGLGIWLHGWQATLLGGIAGFAIMLALYWLGGWFANLLARMRHQENNEVALGFGDVNLSGVLGLLLGWPGITAGLLGAILLGGLGSLIVIVTMLVSRRYQAFVAIPYAPFLIISAVLLLYRS